MDTNALPQTDLLTSFLEQSETVFNIKDLDGKYLYANHQTRSYFPDPDANYINKTDFDLFPIEIARQFRDADLKVIRTGEKLILEEIVNTAKGTATHLSVKFPIYTDDNQMLGTGMFTLDITQRKHLEEEHLSALEKYQQLITALGEISYEYHAPTKHIVWSGQYQNILGYSKNEIGQHESDWSSRIHPDDLCKVENEIERARNNNQVFELEYRFRHANGEYLWFLDRSIMSLDAKGNIINMIGIMRNITQQKNELTKNETLQRQLLQIQKMDALGQLTGGIAHDFNNILSSIRGYTELSIDQASTTDSKHQIEKYLNEVIVATDRAAQLVQQLLAFSRGKTGTPQLITPESGIHEAIKLLHAMIPSSISMEFSLKHHHRYIKIDPVNLQQVLINLILNARDAIHDQTGKIHITLDEKPVSRLTCSSCHENIREKMLSITISDNGEGIPSKEIMDRIFEPFFTTKSDRKGSGMGLSVVHGIMHSCGGHILVSADHDKGASFELLFPESHETPEQSETVHDSFPVNSHNAVREHDASYIMLVDDEVSITSYVSELLQQNHLQVISFNDPVKALATFKSSPDTCSLIITDQTMPQLTGDKLAKSVLAINDDIPIIMCSGYSDIINREKAMAIGITEYLDKPINKNHLLNTIYKLLKNHA